MNAEKLEGQCSDLIVMAKMATNRRKPHELVHCKHCFCDQVQS